MRTNESFSQNQNQPQLLHHASRRESPFWLATLIIADQVIVPVPWSATSDLSEEGARLRRAFTMPPSKRPRPRSLFMPERVSAVAAFAAPLPLSIRALPPPACRAAPQRVVRPVLAVRARPSVKDAAPTPARPDYRARPTSPPTPLAPDDPRPASGALHAADDDEPPSPPKRRRRPVSAETRRKISYTMLGRPKSERMRRLVSEKLKGRVPWNKGKKLSPETRARMSEARWGRDAWNKGRKLSAAHREAISRANVAVQRRLSEATRRRMQMARRRPGDGILSGNSGGRIEVGSYPLVESADINDFVTLRRELRVWSDGFVKRTGRRPSIADIRRLAPVPIMRKFERYVAMRDQIRGLASDVYGAVNPADVPVVRAGEVSTGPRNNNSNTILHVTKHGNPRLLSGTDQGVGYNEGTASMEGAKEDMWDMYDRPLSSEERNEDFHTLIGAHELDMRRKEQLSPNDYRKIGQYRLMETMDINNYVKLRKELQRWSKAFKEEYGRTPTLSDAKTRGKSMLYSRFCEYLRMRDEMSGLVKEVYGTEVDDVETLSKVTAEGKVILETLRGGAVTRDSQSNLPEESKAGAKQR